MHYIFYKTTDVFLAEERLNQCGILTSIVPTPVQDKAYCGVCVYTDNQDYKLVSEALSGMEYHTV